MQLDANIETVVLDERVGKEIDLPRYAKQGDAGLDISACIDHPVTLNPNQSKMVNTGIAIHINDEHVAGFIVPRSGKGSKGLVVGNLVGVIDAHYKGELMVSVWNREEEPWKIYPNDKIAQIVFMPIVRANLVAVDQFSSESDRGGGFGSTDS